MLMFKADSGEPYVSVDLLVCADCLHPGPARSRNPLRRLYWRRRTPTTCQVRVRRSPLLTRSCDCGSFLHHT